jgi:hypothetical protein
VQKGKELNDFQRNLLDIEILSNLRFGSFEIRDTSVTRVTNKTEVVYGGYEVGRRQGTEEVVVIWTDSVV